MLYSSKKLDSLIAKGDLTEGEIAGVKIKNITSPLIPDSDVAKGSDITAALIMYTASKTT